MNAYRVAVPTPEEPSEPPPTIEVTAVECVDGLAAKDQATIAAYQWKVDMMRRRDPNGRWVWEPWPLGPRDYWGNPLNRPCDCCRWAENGMGGSRDHAPKIEHVGGLATEEQAVLADYFRERDAAEPFNWKILRRWLHGCWGSYVGYFVVDKDRDPPIWWDREAFVRERHARFDHDEADYTSTSDEHYRKEAARQYEYDKKRREEWLALRASLPVEQALLDAMPAGSDTRRAQEHRVTMLRFEFDRECAAPRLLTAAEKRAEWLAGVAGMRSRIGDEVARAEEELAELTPKLCALLATLDPASW